MSEYDYQEAHKLAVKEYKKAMNSVDEEINNISEDTPRQETQANAQ